MSLKELESHVNGPVVSRKLHMLQRCVLGIDLMLDRRIRSLIRRYHNYANYKPMSGQNYSKSTNLATIPINRFSYPKPKNWRNSSKSTMIQMLILADSKTYIFYDSGFLESHFLRFLYFELKSVIPKLYQTDQIAQRTKEKTIMKVKHCDNDELYLKRK